MIKKIKAFEYLVLKLADWYKELNRIKTIEHNNLNRLKVLKLHFFVSAVNASEEQEGLLEIFDNFYAMPYGHVESDVYNKINELEVISIDRFKLEIKDYPSANYFNDIETQCFKIDEAISSLKKINFDIINYKALDLVNLSHLWYSWRLVFNYAKQQGVFSSPIPSDLIKREPKIFHLQIYS